MTEPATTSSPSSAPPKKPNPWKLQGITAPHAHVPFVWLARFSSQPPLPLRNGDNDDAIDGPVSYIGRYKNKRFTIEDSDENNSDEDPFNSGKVQEDHEAINDDDSWSYSSLPDLIPRTNSREPSVNDNDWPPLTVDFGDLEIGSDCGELEIVD